ncbi:hypothetical protein [Lutibacter citreus]|uniref:hypothetical protein n=1 Tax=Lutibacter citreus TaxID=2138210 RepID=UPI000DBE569D|nr:hypothetical protein [Lutibacter citreus]
MIQYLKRKEIDIQKYNACIENSINSRIYAYSWYLDCVADNWDVLILNDYEAVMPMPWRQKYFIKYIYPPAWTQQLGIFSSRKLNSDLIRDFINSIPKKFKKVTIQFNAENDLSLFKVENRTNYILPLNKSYEDIYKGFNTNRKRILKSVEKSNFRIEKRINKDVFLKYYLESNKNYKLHPSQLKTLNKLLNSNNPSIKLWGVLKDGNLITGLLWLKEKKQITYLLPFSNQEGKGLGIPTLLVNELMIQFSGSMVKLDFEGSMINGVAGFYKSFGGEFEKYFGFQKMF